MDIEMEIVNTVLSLEDEFQNSSNNGNPFNLFNNVLNEDTFHNAEKLFKGIFSSTGFGPNDKILDSNSKSGDGNGIGASLHHINESTLTTRY